MLEPVTDVAVENEEARVRPETARESEVMPTELEVEEIDNPLTEVCIMFASGAFSLEACMFTLILQTFESFISLYRSQYTPMVYKYNMQILQQDNPRLNSRLQILAKKNTRLQMTDQRYDYMESTGIHLLVMNINILISFI